MEEKTNNKGFNKGLLMAFIGWLLSSITIPTLATIIQQEGLDFTIFSLEQPSNILPFIFIYGTILLIIWGPAAWIISKAYRKKGYNKALLLTVAVYVISALIYFGCTGTI